MAWFGGDEKMKEKLFQRLLKAKRKSYLIEGQADEMIRYAKSKGVVLNKTKVNFLYLLEVE
ncbi:hypothetical protein [Bacillus mojavensis]